MRVQINFQQNNPKFNQSYADEYYNGQESETNWQFEWSRQLKVVGLVKQMLIKKNAVYHLEITANGKTFDYPIHQMSICMCVMENGELVEFAVSEELLEKVKYSKRQTSKTVQIYFSFKFNIEFIQPKEGVYIATRDIPEELIKIQEESFSKSN